MMSNVPTFLNGLVVGVILFQTAIIAPTVFRGLGPDQAGPFLRKVFPKFFVVLVVMGITGTISALASDASYQLWVSLITSTLGLLAYLLIPMTNKSRDEGNEKLFKKLHNASVSMTVLILVVNLFGLAL